MITLGTLDRTAVLYSLANVIGDSGEVTPTLTKVMDYPYRQENQSARTIIAGARDADQLEEVIVGRWVTDFKKSRCQLLVSGEYYRVVKADEIGRQVGLRIYLRLATAD